ncbi:unnamed protein product [Caenorhabditis brenneri]
MGFPVLQLPHVVQRKLVSMLDTRDVIDLSFKCKAFRRMMKFTRLPCKSLKWFFKAGNPGPGITIGYGDRKLKIRLHMRHASNGGPFSNCGEVGSKTIAPSRCRFIRCDTEKNYRVSRHNMWLKNNKKVHPIDMLKTYTNVLIDIFRPDEFRITWRLKNLDDFFKLFVWKITKKFSIFKFRTYYNSDPLNIPNAITFLKNQIEATQKMQLHIEKDERIPSIQQLLKQKRLEIIWSPCFNLGTLLKMECHYLDINRSDLFETGNLKKVIHAWIAGSLPKLECLTVKGRRWEERKVVQLTKGIETFEVTDKPDPEVFSHHTWNENAVEIVRDFDKRRASIFLDETKFALIIWSANGVLEKTKPAEWEPALYSTVREVRDWDSGDDTDDD